jgi:membrane fusion protein (multidrug efflux system)
MTCGDRAIRSRLSVPLAWLLAAAAAASCGSPADSAAVKGPPPVSVELVSVEHRPIRDVVQFVGQLEAEESVPLRSEVDGIVASVEFQEGDRVAKGALLFRLRDDEQRARLRAAEASLVLARQQYERAKELVDRRTVSQSEYDNAAARLGEAEARRDLMNVQLRQTEIRAPFDGVLGARLVSPGERVSEETDLVRIDAVDRLRLLFSVPEIALNAITVDLPLELSVAPWPERRFSGTVYFVAPSVDTATRRMLVKAWVPNPDRRLRPGMFANVDLELARKEHALAIPESALAYDAVGPHVWRVDENDAAERVGVELGIRRDALVEILSGLAAGDRIVSAGVHKVSAGSRVQAATLSAKQAGGASATP